MIETKRNIAFEKFLKMQHPQDIVLYTTNEIEIILKIYLLTLHEKQFPNELATIQFDPDPEIKYKYRIQGDPISILGSNKTVLAYIGTLVKVLLEIIKHGLPQEQKYAG